jgi:hypothetical protein
VHEFEETMVLGGKVLDPEATFKLRQTNFFLGNETSHTGAGFLTGPEESTPPAIDGINHTLGEDHNGHLVDWEAEDNIG